MKTSPAKGDFASLMMDRIYQAGEKAEITYDRKAFCLRGGGKPSVTHCLVSAYEEYRSASAAHRERLLKDGVRHWFAYLPEIPDDFDDVKPDLLPVVRSRSYFEFNTLREQVGGGEQLDWPYQVLGEHFGVGLVYDLPAAMRPLAQANLDAWGITFYEALEIATENLREIPATFVGPTHGDGVYLSETEDSYDTSRLLFPEVIRQFHITGDPIAMVLTRAHLVVIGADDVERLSGITEAALGAVASPHYISGIALHFDGDQWMPWLPPPSHPAYRGFRELQIQTWEVEYAEQKDLLDKLHAKNGEDISSAKYSVIQSPEGKLFSYAIWAPDSNHALLPKTDLLAFGPSGKRSPTVVEWEKVVELTGEMMEAVDIYPPRFRVRGFPSDERLAAMGNMLS